MKNKLFTLSLFACMGLQGVYAVDEVNQKNSMIGEGEKVIHSNTMGYIAGKAYNYHDHTWENEQYRIVRKNNEMLGAYIIDQVGGDGERLGILYMSKYLKDIQLARSIIKKDTIEYTHFYLLCNKEFKKNNQLKNKYYENENFKSAIFDENMSTEITPSYAQYRDFNLICKHTYIDKTNQI